MNQLLLVNEELATQRILRAACRRTGDRLSVATSGERALDVLALQPIDVVLVAFSLPDVPCVQFLQDLRAWSQVPTIVVSPSCSARERVAALDAGADDFVQEPFVAEELLARIRALVRRAGDHNGLEGPLRFNGLTVDLARRLVTDKGTPVHLTPTEFRLLEALITHPGACLSHRWLLERVWGLGYRREVTYLRVFVRQLRRKLDNVVKDPSLIATEWGVGYRWIQEPD